MGSTPVNDVDIDLPGHRNPRAVLADRLHATARSGEENYFRPIGKSQSRLASTLRFERPGRIDSPSFDRIRKDPDLAQGDPAVSNEDERSGSQHRSEIQDETRAPRARRASRAAPR